MSHLHSWPGDLDCRPLADDVCITPVPSGDAYLIGFEVPGEDRWQVGRVPISADHWQATGSLDDGTLTLSPSVDFKDGRQHRHGWIRDGKWVEA